MRTKFSQLFKDMPHIPPPYCYRCPFELSYPQCDIRCATELEEEILECGPENVSSFLAEPISGATLGAVVPPKEYWPIIREICTRYDVLLIADEVMTGMGRSGKWFAVDHWQIEPDLMTIGKGATGGYFPLSILAVKGELVETVAVNSGDFSHGGTYTHHSVGTAVGLATIEYIIVNQLIDQVTTMGKKLKSLLDDKILPIEIVGDVRGKGLMWGIELVQDEQTKAPFDSQLQINQRVADEAFARGLITYPGGGCIDGYRGDHLMIGPPFTITDDQLARMVEIIFETLRSLEFS
jgi:adenosylmethionine-8-amino-7-oxononanoate aminotransferase